MIPWVFNLFKTGKLGGVTLNTWHFQFPPWWWWNKHATTTISWGIVAFISLIFSVLKCVYQCQILHTLFILSSTSTASSTQQSIVSKGYCALHGQMMQMIYHWLNSCHDEFILGNKKINNKHFLSLLRTETENTGGWNILHQGIWEHEYIFTYISW